MRYGVVITEETVYEFEFSDEDIEDGDTPEQAAIELYQNERPQYSDLVDVEITEMED